MANNLLRIFRGWVGGRCRTRTCDHRRVKQSQWLYLVDQSHLTEPGQVPGHARQRAARAVESPTGDQLIVDQRAALAAFACACLCVLATGCGGAVPTAPVLPPTGSATPPPTPAPTPTVPELLGTTFLAFGDSITAGEINSDTAGLSRALRVMPELSYPTQLADLLRAAYPSQAAAIAVINAGQNGETADEGTRRLPGLLAETHPHAVLLMEGLNGLDASLIAPTIDELRADIRSAKAAGVLAIYLATLTPAVPGTLRGSGYADVVPVLNQQIRALADSEQVVLVDVYADLTQNVSSWMGPDGLHPTAAGYAEIAKTFAGRISATLERR